MRDLMFASVWAVLLPLSLMSAQVGVLLWVWVALLAPNDLLFGFMGSVPFNKLVAVSTCGCILLSKAKKDPYLDASFVLLLLFGSVATISWADGLVSDASSTDLYLKLIKEIVLAFVIALVMTTRHRIHLLVLVITASLGFLAVKEGLISLLTAGGHKVIGSVSVGDNNSLATALLMIVPLIYYLIQHSAVRGLRVALWAAFALAVVTVIATNSRGGFIGLLVLAAFMVMNSRNKWTGLLVIALAGLMIYLLAPESWFQRLNTIENADNDGSFMGRVVAWKISLLIALDHPLFGGGMHAVQNFWVWSTYRPFLDAVDFVTTPPADFNPHAAHSIYFEVLGDLGFVGLALFLAMLAAAFFNCWKLHRLAKQDAELAWAADLARMLQISLVIYVVTAAALSMAYFELIYILMALASRCRRTVELTLATQAAETVAQRDGPAREPPFGSRLPQFAATVGPAANAGNPPGRHGYAR